jgi:hypothetical protein
LKTGYRGSEMEEVTRGRRKCHNVHSWPNIVRMVRYVSNLVTAGKYLA